ncbi:MAG: hypothetical protein QNK11_07035 [Legionella sp.]|nr:hypothetical protein [Legionella sp.]
MTQRPPESVSLCQPHSKMMKPYGVNPTGSNLLFNNPTGSNLLFNKLKKITGASLDIFLLDFIGFGGRKAKDKACPDAAKTSLS